MKSIKDIVVQCMNLIKGSWRSEGRARRGSESQNRSMETGSGGRIMTMTTYTYYIVHIQTYTLKRYGVSSTVLSILTSSKPGLHQIKENCRLHHL